MKLLRQWFGLYIVVFGFFALSVTAAHAGASDAIDRGNAWLTLQVDVAGDIAATSLKSSLLPQAQSELVLALAAQSKAIPAPLIDATLSFPDGSEAEWLARKMAVAAAASRPFATFKGALLTQQKIGSGWGLTAEHDATVLDTAYALMALAGNSPYEAHIADAVALIKSAQSADGGFGSGVQVASESTVSSVYVTAQVMLAMSAWRNQGDVAQVLNAAGTWLLTARNNGYYDSTIENAIALLALSRITNDSAVIQPLIDVLVNAQNSDGSWGGDVFATALAVRALSAPSSVAPAPQTASIAGIAIDADTLQALEGVTVQLVAAGGASVQVPAVSTSTNGGFLLSNVPAGAYQLTLGKLGYANTVLDVSVAAGQVLRLGDVTLKPSALTATLTGVIVDASANPIAGVVVNVSTASALTDANGRYTLTGLSAGSYTVLINAASSGYQSISTAVTLQAGQTVVYSPVLGTQANTTLAGVVVDFDTNQPVADVTVDIGNAAAQTNAQGEFVFDSSNVLTVGAFTLQLNKLGYQSATFTGQITAGANTVGVLKLRPVSASLPSTNTASLSGIVATIYQTPLAGVTVEAAGQSAITDATGAYQLSQLPPGVTTIRASMVGYETVSVLQKLDAGIAYIFSPNLVDTGNTSPVAQTATLVGTVVGAGGVPIDGATVSVGPLSVNTAADGRFTLTGLAAGDISIAISAVGYQAATFTGALALGVNDAGSIVLAGASTSRNLTGVIIDANTRNPIAGATVALVGRVGQVSTGVDGRYTISNITDAQATISVGATGYATQTLTINFTQQGDARLDVTLVRPVASNISINFVRTDKPQYGPSELVTLEAEIQNSSNQTASVVVEADVRNSQNQVVYTFMANAPTGWAGQRQANQPVLVPAAGILDVPMDWFMLRQPAGVYQITAKALDATGKVVAEGSAQFTVASQMAMRGGATTNPPVVQYGTQQPVVLTADITNVGNQEIPSGDLQVKVVLEAADTNAAATASVSTRVFASGAPFEQADYRGLVADGAGNLYTVMASPNALLKFDATGHGSVIATPSGQGWLTDLALDAAGHLWVMNSSGELSQISINGQTLRTLQVSSMVEVSRLTIAANGQIIVTGLLHNSYQPAVVSVNPATGAETVLFSGGLSHPTAFVEDGQGNLIVTNYGDNTLSKVSVATGEIEPFVEGLSRPLGIARDGSGYFYVANNADQSILKISPQGAVSTFATGINDPQDLKFGQGGVLFVSSSADNAIYAVSPAGAVSLFAKGLANRPAGMRYDAQNNLWIANEDGTLRQYTSGGQVNLLATGIPSPRGIALDGTGRAYVASQGSGAVHQVSGGISSPWVTGLNAPSGVAVDASGLIWVSSTSFTNYGAGLVQAYDASGTLVSSVESLLNSPRQIKVAADGTTYIANGNNTITVRSPAGANRLFYQAPANLSLDGFAIDPQTGLLVVRHADDVYKLDANGVPTLWVSLPTGYSWGSSLAVDAAGNAYVINAATGRFNRISTTGQVSVFADELPLGDYWTKLANSTNGMLVATAAQGNYYHFTANGGLIANTPVVPSNSGVYWLDIAADGGVLVHTYDRQVYHLSPTTGAVLGTLDDSNRSSTLPIAYSRKTTGQWLAVTASPDELLESVNATSALQTVLSGFVNLQDITWNGTELLAVGNHSGLYRWTSANPYPVRHAANFLHSGYLSAHQGVVYTASAGNIQAQSLDTGATLWAAPTPYSLEAGIAANAAGVTAGHFQQSAATQLTHQGDLVAVLGGIAAPQGLAFDAQGRLWVANSSSRTIVRFTPGNAAPAVVALLQETPTWLAVDAQDQVWFSTWDQSAVKRLDATGGIVETVTITDNRPVYGIGFVGGQLMGAGRDTHTIHKQQGAELRPLIAALSGAPVGVAATPDGSIWLASGGNGGIVRLSNQRLWPFASGFVGMNSMHLTNDGAYIGGSDGWVKHISTSAVVTDLKMKVFANGSRVSGLATRANGDLFVLYPSGAANYPVIMQTQVARATVSPAVGTVVHQAQVPMAAMPVGAAYQTIALGQWLPPYGGDFKIEVTRPGVNGTLTNMVHVGAHATGELVAVKSELPPGDTPAPMCLKVDGADFTSVSRVEVANIKPVATTDFPKGLAANRAGDVFYLDSQGANLYKAQPGQTPPVVVASGLKTSFGLAIDDQEQFFVASLNEAKNSYELLAIKEGSAPRVVVDLGVTRANGVVVNPQGDVLVGSPGKLLRINPQGQLTEIPNLGMPDPRGIAVDGKGTVYVQNDYDQLVAKIAPDGATTVVFSGGDGIDNPQFEGDGYPNIAADCSENFYIAPWLWHKIGIKDVNEEHVLAQVIGRSGQATALFDTLKISPTLSDVDFLSFDRLGNRILMWNHGTNQVWSVPVTCGAISVDAHLLSKPGQTFSSATKAPTASIPLADGRVEHVWSLKDVTASGAQICFDASQTGLTLGETRKAIDSGYLNFKNSFATDTVKVPLDIPNIHAGNLLAMLVQTDKPEYSPNAVAQIGAQLDNPNVKDVAGQVTLEIFDALGNRVGTVSQQSVAIPAKRKGLLRVKAQSQVSGPFDVKNIVPGTYTVKGSLYVQGVLSATAKTTFKVLSDLGAGGAQATASVRVDKTQYQPNERVQIDSTVTNTSVNTTLDNLRLVLDVRNASNQSVFSHTHNMAQLTPGAVRQLSVGQQLNSAGAGTYSVSQTLLDASNTVLHATQTSFVVNAIGAIAGTDLRGTLQANPGTAQAGAVVQINAQVQNLAGQDLTGAQVSIVIINADTGAQVHRHDSMQNLSGNSSMARQIAWNTPSKRFAAPTSAVQNASKNSGIKTSATTKSSTSVPHVALLIVTLNPGQPNQQALTLAQAPFNVVQAAPALSVAGIPIFGGSPGSLGHTLNILFWVLILGALGYVQLRRQQLTSR